MARFRNFENMLRIFAFHEKVNRIYFRENIKILWLFGNWQRKRERNC